MQVASNMTPAEAKVYAEYKAKQAAQQAENQLLEQQKQQHQEAAKARFQAARLNEIHTATKDYECQCCGKTIPKGSQYRRQNIPVGFGFVEGTHYQQRITHLVCVVGAKQ